MTVRHLLTTGVLTAGAMPGIAPAALAEPPGALAPGLT